MKHVRNQRGQGLIEYLIIVALMGVAAIAIVRTLGSTVNTRFTNITYALRGQERKINHERIDDSYYKKKDLGDFFNGVGSDNEKD